MESIIARSIAIILLLIALGDLPYGYYTLLRLVVCGASVWSAFIAAELDKRIWLWLLGFIALLFNPIIPIHLDRATWASIDIITAVVIFISIFIVNENKVMKCKKIMENIE